MTREELIAKIKSLPEASQSLASRKTDKPETNMLKAVGDFRMKLKQVNLSDSFKKWDGSMKSKLPGFVNPTDELHVLLEVLDGVHEGKVHYERIALGGFLKQAKLSQEDKDSGKFTPIRGYACTKDKDGKYHRISGQAEMDSIKSIQNYISNAVGKAGGDDEFVLGIFDAFTEGVTFGVKIESEPYEPTNTIQYSVGQWYPAEATVNAEPTAEELTASAEDFAK